MSGPFIFIATNRLKPGKFGDERARVPGLVEFIEANELQLLAFNEYANERGTEVAVVEVHPDADSMAFHMEVWPSVPQPHMHRPSTRPRTFRSSAHRAKPFWTRWVDRQEPAWRWT